MNSEVEQEISCLRESLLWVTQNYEDAMDNEVQFDGLKEIRAVITRLKKEIEFLENLVSATPLSSNRL